MSHSHGRKRRAYESINGHLFSKARKADATGRRVADKSLCGLTMAEAANAASISCRQCDVAKEQLWA